MEQLQEKVAQLTAAKAAQDKVIDEMKQKEAGWLVLCDNPTYNGTTMGILFTDGAAFIPVNRECSRVIVNLPAENQIESMEKTDAGKKQLAQIKAAATMPTSERAVAFLVNNFGYHAQFYSKDQQDELQKRISARAQERAEALAILGNQSEQMEKLLSRHNL